MSTLLNTRIVSKSNNLDFMRFCAASLVMYGHAYQITGRFEKEPFYRFTNEYMHSGSLFVAIFFIISGMLITKSYLHSKSLREYVIARAIRIYPALIVVVFLTVFVVGPYLSTVTVPVYFSSQMTYLFLLNALSIKTYTILPGVFSTNPVNLVNGCLWTLPYELLCYAIVAFAGALNKSRYLSAFMLGLIILSMVYLIGFSNWRILAQFSIYFFGGSLIYLFKNKIRLNNFITFTFIIALFVLLQLKVDSHFKNLALTLMLPYILVNLAYLRSPLHNFAKHGDFSYGIYIMGFTVQQALYSFYPNFNQHVNFGLSMIVTVILSYFSWHIVEKSALKYKKVLCKGDMTFESAPAMSI
jgi:peptidoglycan/LPS O-acetylase OafA/YrhL